MVAKGGTNLYNSPMREFEFTFPTRILFARDAFRKVGEIASPLGSRFLLVTGKSFARKQGLVDEIVKQLSPAKVVHFNGITPNPKVEEVERGTELARREGADAVIALGGGSVMDASKFIAALAVSEGNPWDYATGKRKFSASLPVITVPTVPASGSEADPFAVLSNPRVGEKRGLYSPHFWPKVAVWDPLLTHTLPSSVLKDGVVDIISHAIEGYISGQEAKLQNRFTEGLVKTVMEAWEELSRGNKEVLDALCWASTLAISPFLSAGRGGHFVLHGIEHALSGLYDHITHGSGLAALLVPYLRTVAKKRPQRVSSLTKALFDLYHWETGLGELEEWMKKWGLHKTLKELGVKDLHTVEEKAWQTSSNRLESVGLSRADLRRILEEAYD